MFRYIYILLLFICTSALAQSPLTSNSFNYHLIDRYEIKSGSLYTDVFTGIKPFRRDRMSNIIDGIDKSNGKNKFNADYLRKDNILWNEKLPEESSTILKYFFKNENALLSVNNEDFKMQITPILGFRGGTTSTDSLNMYQNTRGFELRGSIGKKVGFYTNALENQYRYPDFLRTQHDTTGVVPGTTLHKPVQPEGEDFFNVAGYITFSPIKEIQVQFGQDRNFIGNGYRSLILSDHAASYPFLKINTQVWKINYQNLYMQHTDFKGQTEKFKNGRKFSAFHHLSMNLGKNLTIGMFENVVFDRQDSNETNRFETAYLNPLIFYRAVEHGLNSSDNVILGMDLKWNFLNRFSVYGQLVFDEFIKDEFFSASSSYVNKWAYQLGMKYIDVAGIQNLDLQIEVNQARPFMYSHNNISQNWAHYNQTLAHPLGSNFREYLGIVRYQPIDRLTINVLWSNSTQGLDSSTVSLNYGGNILRPIKQVATYNQVELFQGIKNTVSSVSLNISYMPWHNVFVDAGVYSRNVTNSFTGNSNTLILHAGLRMNMDIFRFD